MSRAYFDITSPAVERLVGSVTRKIDEIANPSVDPGENASNRITAGDAAPGNRILAGDAATGVRLLAGDA